MFASSLDRCFTLGLMAACLTCLQTASLSKAQDQPKPAATNSTGASKPAGGVLGELKTIKTMLEKADHDYQGHRANAVREVGHAIREIERAKAKHRIAPLTPQQKAARAAARQAQANAPAAGNQAPKPQATNAGNAEPQATSDAQLRTALTMLNQIASRAGTKHPKVLGHVQTAIQELNTALSIK